GHPHPPDPGGCDSVAHVKAVECLPQEIGETNAGTIADRVPAPDPKIHVQEIQDPRARVPLELNFDQPGHAEASGQPRRGGGHLGLIDAEHVGAGSTEVHWIPAEPLATTDAIGRPPTHVAAKESWASPLRG